MSVEVSLFLFVFNKVESKVFGVMGIVVLFKELNGISWTTTAHAQSADLPRDSSKHGSPDTDERYLHRTISIFRKV